MIVQIRNWSFSAQLPNPINFKRSEHLGWNVFHCQMCLLAGLTNHYDGSPSQRKSFRHPAKNEWTKSPETGSINNNAPDLVSRFVSTRHFWKIKRNGGEVLIFLNPPKELCPAQIQFSLTKFEQREIKKGQKVALNVAKVARLGIDQVINIGRPVNWTDC